MTTRELSPRPKAAELLIDRELPNGWVVVERLERPDDVTGGHFSVPYLVERVRDGVVERAFLKALDFTMVREIPLPTVDALAWLTSGYQFERDLVLRCAANRMTNVITGIDSGDLRRIA